MKNLSSDFAYKNSNRYQQYSNETRHTKESKSGKEDSQVSGKFGRDSSSQLADTSRKAIVAMHAASTATGKHQSSAPSSATSVAASASPYADHDELQRTNTSNTAAGKGAMRRSQVQAVQPTLRTIDKAFIDAEPTDLQVESAIEVCSERVRADRGTQITSQSRFWGKVFNLHLDPSLDTDHTRNPSVTLCFNSKGKNSSVAFQLQLNPHKFSKANTDQLIELWESLFPFGYRDVRTSARFSRLDEAADASGLLDNFIFDRKASQTREHYFIRTDRKGMIQTGYIGEATAAVHGTIYNRHLAELFRNQRGEVVPLNEETATQILRQVGGLVRVESRRNLHPKLTFEELADLPSSFAEYNLFDLSRLKPKDRNDYEFMYYIELVRLRGLHGAKHRLLELHGKSPETKRKIMGFEERLARTQCEWWNQLDRTQQLGALFDSLPIKKFLSKIGSR
jgi:hypothetical protein